MTIDRLVYMANQIGRELSHQDQSKAVPAIRDHLRSFWEPHMRREIIAHWRAGGADLLPSVREAIAQLAAAGP